jgi:hypothetical protein
MYYLHQIHVRHFTGIRETDIQDYYLPSPLVANTGGTQIVCFRISPIPLPARRLVRRRRD